MEHQVRTMHPRTAGSGYHVYCISKETVNSQDIVLVRLMPELDTSALPTLLQSVLLEAPNTPSGGSGNWNTKTDALTSSIYGEEIPRPLSRPFPTPQQVNLQPTHTLLCTHVLFSSLYSCTVLSYALMYCSLLCTHVLFSPLHSCTVLSSALMYCSLLYTHVLFSPLHSCTVLSSALMYCSLHVPFHPSPGSSDVQVSGPLPIQLV